MNQSGTSDNLLGSEGGARPEYCLPDSDSGGASPQERASPRERAVVGSRRRVVRPAAEEITEASSSPESSGEEDQLPHPEEEKGKFQQLMEVDDRPAEVRARLRKQWQKQRTASVLSVLTMNCLRTAKDTMDSNNQEELEPDKPCCRYIVQA